MPVDFDIKDAGALADFVRWGWPWHGLCTGTTIAGSGKTIEQPISGNTWLIDKGLDPLDISPAEVASEAAEGREWRNYGLISGGVVHGKRLPMDSDAYSFLLDTYIHIDEAGVPWMITLTYSFPSSNVLRVTAAIVRFGLFDQDLGPQTPTTQYADASCEGIDLFGSFYARRARLHDVYTNGSKAAVCVEFTSTEIIDTPEITVMSIVEVTFSGSGGADGSGLSIAAVEAKSKSEIYLVNNYTSISAGGYGTGVYGGSVGVLSPIYSDCSDNISTEIPGFIETGVELTWPASTDVLQSGSDHTQCRTCFYDALGALVTANLRIQNFTTGTITVTSAPTLVVDTIYLYCDTGTYSDPIEMNATMAMETTTRKGYSILHDATLIDEIVLITVVSKTANKRILHNGAAVSDVTPTPTGSTSSSWSGSLTAGFPTSSVNPTPSQLRLSWTSPYDGDSDQGTLSTSPSVVVGLRRIGHSAAFYLDASGTRTYGTVGTPAGNKSTALTGEYYFSWQRKTDDFAFSASPICYV